jgi:hypothetical protein
MRIVLEMEEDANLNGVLKTCKNLMDVKRIEIE